jgi:hypothetical protein
MNETAAAAPRSPHETRFVLLAVVSFLLYALGVLTLHQDSQPGWGLEGQGPLPAAISHLIYGTPLGAVDHNMIVKFLNPNGASIQDVVATAATGSIPRGEVDRWTPDGLGAGMNVFATIAMWMFGIKISSLTLLYLVFIGISVFAFVWRYRDQRLLAVPLYFLAATVMLATPLGSSARDLDQMPIGGYRYFVLASILPVLYIFFDLIDRAVPRYHWQIANWLPLLIQGLLLFAALLARSSTAYLLGVLLVVLIRRLYLDRNNRDQLIVVARKSATVAAAFGFWAVFVAAALPAYVQSGHVFGVFWHRAFISFSVNPDWPFGNLQKAYDCRKFIPEGIAGAPDRNAHCVWLAYPPNSERPVGDVNRDVYGGQYEKVLRSAYFNVLIHYPRQVFETYFFLKSRLIANALHQAVQYLFRLDQAPVAKGLFAIVAAQLFLFISFVISTAFAGLAIVDRRMLIFPILFLLSLAPPYVAWAAEFTITDTILLMYSCLVLPALVLLQLLTRIVVRRGHQQAF